MSTIGPRGPAGDDQELARYSATDYDWRRCEAKLNALPQFTTEIDGLDIHFIDVKSRHENALPVIITHGWPGSIIEMLDVVDPLTDPTKYGGNAEDAFDVVMPSHPGYGFSQSRRSLAGTLAALPGVGGADAPPRLHPLCRSRRRCGRIRHRRDGSPSTQRPARHPHEFARDGPGGASIPRKPEEERAAREEITTFSASGNGYFIEQDTRPQTIGYALLDSPVALAAWMLDHDTDAYYKISRAFVDGQPSGNLTRDHILDNITLYWLTGTGASAARSYWENAQAAVPAAGQAPPEVSLPVGFTTFPGEIWRTPRSWVEKSYPNVTYFNEVDKGGHFAAWEEPELFATRSGGVQAAALTLACRPPCPARTSCGRKLDMSLNQ